MTESSSEVSQLLDSWSRGDPEALDQLMPLVVDELHRIASNVFRGESLNQTLQPTAVVNEAYLKLKDQRQVQWHSRVEFFAVAATKIRWILVDHARRRQAEKRGGRVLVVPLDEVVVAPAEQDPDLIALDDALRDLARLDPREARIVEMRIFGGLTRKEIAGVERIGLSTVCREWDSALLWLRRQLSRDSETRARKARE